MNHDKIDPIQAANRPYEKPKDLLDLTQLIRSIQRREDNTDCYGKAGDSCDHKDCLWRPWCVKAEEGPVKEE